MKKRILAVMLSICITMLHAPTIASAEEQPTQPTEAIYVTEDNYASLGLSEQYTGFYAIGNADQLRWFSNYVNSGHTMDCGVLTSDITLAEWTDNPDADPYSHNVGIVDADELEIEPDQYGVIPSSNFTPIGDCYETTETEYGAYGQLSIDYLKNKVEEYGADNVIVSAQNDSWDYLFGYDQTVTQIMEEQGLETVEATINYIDQTVTDNVTDGWNNRSYDIYVCYTYTVDHSYRGTFDGAGHTISGLCIRAMTTDNQGLFGVVSGRVENVTINNSYVCGGQGSGLVVGRLLTGGQINNCHVNQGSRIYGFATSRGAYIGGICGYNVDGTITGCSYSGAYGATSSEVGNMLGGVVGVNNGDVEKCVNNGVVSSTVSLHSVGGIVGVNEEDGNVNNCYNLGDLDLAGRDGSNNGSVVGGIVGVNFGSIDSCYNYGQIEAHKKYWDYNAEYCGAIVGQNSGTSYISSGKYENIAMNGQVNNCYYLENCANLYYEIYADGDFSGWESIPQTGIGRDASGVIPDDVPGDIASKTAAQFASGEVTWLLNTNCGTTSSSNVFAQGERYPIFAVETSPDFVAANLHLKNDVSISYFIDKGDGSVPEVKIYDTNGNLIKTLDVNPSGTQVQNTWKFTLDGVSAKRTADKFIAVASYDGEPATVLEYSVAKYCYDKLADTSSTSELKTLCADLLNYASSSQTYFNYKASPDELANSQMTTEMQSSATNDPEYIDSITDTYKGTDFSGDGMAEIYAISLLMKDQVNLKYYYRLNDDTLTADNVKLKVTINNVDTLFDATTANIGGQECVSFTVNTLKASMMSDKVEACLTNADGTIQYSGLTTYSIETYAAKKKNDENVQLATLVIDMMKYGDSAKTFFSAT